MNYYDILKTNMINYNLLIYKGVQRVERTEREYWELLEIVDRAKEELQRLMKETQKLPEEIFKISSCTFNYSTVPERKYYDLADKVRCASNGMEDIEKQWTDITRGIEAVQFQLFLAQAHILVCRKYKNKNMKYKEIQRPYRRNIERQYGEWRKRYRTLQKG